ncbi:MAG: dynamin family protein [Methylacidiphilales bacterium]|nr:dynamin family protein [Candidatus Methylacidiphilales bacterium]NJR17996.1 dynamin family protein [Calothrix sp. CSU_2_0]
MATSLVGLEVVDLLSRITGKKLSQRDLTPPVIFLASLVTILLGVIFVDGTVAESEKQRLLTTLYRFSTPESDVRRLTHLMIKGVKENQIYRVGEELLSLTASLTESQRLLLMSFGYEMSAADGEMDSREKKYLEIIAKRLVINPRHLAVLEATFARTSQFESTALEEVHFLLDPVQFHELDSIFVKAAKDISLALPVKDKTNNEQNTIAISYERLKNFQESSKKIDILCSQIYQVIQECHERGFLPNNLILDITDVSKKLQSQNFRIAVVGEFSKGKSTLLNALLGEEIQPAREIPCSGTVTVLKYGKQKRVICRYRDGREEEIPFSEYQQKASISEDAAIGCLSDELAQSEIEEIIFEHPDLELCSSGVEIIDSPGLNEHLERTAITQKLLENTDAIIFLTDVTRSLTQVERDLLQELKVKMNGGKETEIADNIFVVGNFMDLVRTEKGREQVKQRIENFVLGDKPIVAIKNRVHFISAQATLDALKSGSENEYLKTFQDFTHSLEDFLTMERGELKVKRAIDEVNSLLHQSFNGLNRAEDTLEGKLKLSELEKQSIIDQIGEASGRDVKIQLIVANLKSEVFDQAVESWKEWYEGLLERMMEKSERWYSEHSPVWSQDKLIRDYTNCFIRDLSVAIDEWGNKQLKEVILQQSIDVLNTTIEYELDAIQTQFQNIDIQANASFSDRLKLSIHGISDDFMGFGGVGGGVGIGGALAAGLIIFTGVGFIAVIIASVAAAIASSFGLGMFDIDGLHDQIKIKVLEMGFEKLSDDESIDKIFEKLEEIIDTIFDSKVESASRIISEAISLYENLLEQQEKVHESTLEELEASKTCILSQRQELEQVREAIRAVVTPY